MSKNWIMLSYLLLYLQTYIVKFIKMLARKKHTHTLEVSCLTVRNKMAG